jgi:hypothetical protein
VSIVDVEHRDGQAALANVDAKLELERAHGPFRSQPSADTGRASAGVWRRREDLPRWDSELRRLLHTPAAITTVASLVGVLLGGLLVRVLLVRRTLVPVLFRARVLLWLLIGLLGLPGGARHRGASLVSHRDEERRDMLAVLPRFLESRARAV